MSETEYNINCNGHMSKTEKGGVVMPRRDGTGPMGLGAGSGRGMGACTRAVVTAGTCLGLGLGYRYGGRFGRAKNNKEQLIAQRDNLKAKLEEVENQISQE